MPKRKHTVIVENEFGLGDVERPTKDPKASMEKDTDSDLKEFEKGLSDMRKAEAARFNIATQSGFALTLVFQSADQLTEFIKKAKWGKMVYEQWMDGMELAEHMGIKLENPPLPYDINRVRINQRLAELTEPDERSGKVKSGDFAIE